MTHVDSSTSVIGRIGNGLNRLANPNRFLSFADRILPWLTAGVLVLFAIGFYMVFYSVPPDYQQGHTVKIMYLHVPSAWLAMLGYTIIGIASIGSLIWRHPLADVAAKSALPIGAAFTLITLLTGSLWGKPMWGTYWVWDARLTSVLILFFLYLGLMALWKAIEDPSKAGKAAAILAIAGLINVPIIKFSVDWWSTLHQPASVLKLDGPAIHPSMLVPLLIMAVAFTGLFLVLHMHAMKNEIFQRRVQTARMRQVRGTSDSSPAREGQVS